ncbi:MAG: putative secreted protein [Herbinix sp.]|nr:putative secreted protein [Herbinix sp.]
MKKRKIYAAFACLLTLVLLFTACAKMDKQNNSVADKGDSSSGYDGADKDFNEGSYTSAPETEAEEPAYDRDDSGNGELSNTASISTDIPEAGNLDKIIRRVYLDVETQEFDRIITSINQKIKSLGGYVESSRISGRSYYEDGNRYGEIIARVPKDNLNELVDNVRENANIVDENESTENVTLDYIDAESHKKTLQIEQERLLALLGKAESLEDILVLESRLSNIRYELEKYEIQLRTYDNLVEYSTVTLSVREVERISPIEGEKGSTWERIKNGFGDTIYSIGKGLENLLVWFVVNLPYLLIWAVIIMIGILLGRRLFRKATLKKLTSAPQVPPAPVHGPINGNYTGQTGYDGPVNEKPKNQP